MPNTKLNQKEIMGIIPHRPPFLFVDEIIELEPGQKAVGVYQVKKKDCEGHFPFPKKPLMPGVLIIEAMNQTGAVALLSSPEFTGKTPVFAGIDEARFKHTVGPGFTLWIEVKKIWQRSGYGRCEGKVSCNGQIIASGKITFGVI